MKKQQIELESNQQDEAEENQSDRNQSKYLLNNNLGSTAKLTL